VKPIRDLIERTLVDSHLQPRVWGEMPLSRAVALSARYRTAAHDVYLTKNERRLASFRNAHLGERCFILGNGPSLNRCDLSKLAGEATFGVNSIFLKTAETGFCPTYYVVEDILVAEDRAKQIAAYRGPRAKFFGNYLRRFLSDGPEVCWTNVRVDYRNYENFPHFSEDAVRQIWVGGTVSYVCLQLAFLMGFREVYLIGFDHDYVVPADAKLDGNRIETTSIDPNHIHPDYFGKGLRWHQPRVDRMEIAYVRAKEHFERAGRRVFNATVGGKLEVFDRVHFDSLFAPRSRRAA
jgi:hypothetical protein